MGSLLTLPDKEPFRAEVPGSESGCGLNWIMVQSRVFALEKERVSCAINIRRLLCASRVQMDIRHPSRDYRNLA